MDALRKSLLFVSVPLVLLVVVGTIRARVDESRDRLLRDLKVFTREHRVGVEQQYELLLSLSHAAQELPIYCGTYFWCRLYALSRE